MKTIFITRTQKKEDLKELVSLIKEVWDSGIQDIYIISDFDDSNANINSIPVTVIKDENPTSPVSINTVLRKIREMNKAPDAFLISSKEVTLTKNKIEELIKMINNNDDLLVAGYKLKIEDKKLNDELNSYYTNKNLIAYKVPWNTCAIWNYKLFDRYVSKFDEITARNPFDKVEVNIDGINSKTPHQGMEDGLAIAQAVSNKKKQIYFKLIQESLVWKPNNLTRHREKLARKDPVMRNFMAIRNYSVRDLENAKR